MKNPRLMEKPVLMEKTAVARPPLVCPRFKDIGFALALSFLLGACTVGPDYVRPQPETLPGADAELFTAAEAAAENHRDDETGPTLDPDPTLGPDPDGGWWTAVGDETLAELVELALEGNFDLEAAHARVRQARAGRRAVAAAGRPSLGANASGQRARASETTPEGALASAGLSELTQNRYGSFLSASWELDLFGGVRRASEAADARIDEAVAGVAGVELGLIAEVARTYVELRGAQRRLALAQENVDLQQESSRRIEDLHRVGLGSRLDAERAKALVAGTRARLAPLRAAIRGAAHRLAVLTGQAPEALLDRLEGSAPLVHPPDLVPVGLRSELLRRRPDLLAAERRLAAASAEVGVATAQLYPRFFLTGAGGFESTSFSDLFESASRTWSLGPSISWPIFQGGRLRAGIDAAEAAYDEALATYRGAVLLAVEDVETALINYAEEELRRRALAEAADASAEAVKLARIVYEKGLESYLTVLDAERTLVDVQDQLASSETGLLLRLTALYAALGGGWHGADSHGADSHGADSHGADSSADTTTSLPPSNPTPEKNAEGSASPGSHPKKAPPTR